MSSKAARQTRGHWPPLPGATCRVNGQVGRYVGGGVGAYLKHTDESGQFISDPTKRRCLYFTATRAHAGDGNTHSSMLPSNEQLEVIATELGIKR